MEQLVLHLYKEKVMTNKRLLNHLIMVLPGYTPRLREKKYRVTHGILISPSMKIIQVIPLD